MDGTLLGPGGGLFAGPDGEVAPLGAKAIEACLRSGIEVVVIQGGGAVRRSRTPACSAKAAASSKPVLAS